jgi:hypothetical protein
MLLRLCCVSPVSTQSMGERGRPRGGDDPVSPELFAFVDEVAEEIASQDELQKTLDADEGLLLFAREFYVQFFENVLKAPITSISTKSGLRANRLMRSKRGDWDRPTQALVRRFQRLCKIYTELLGEQYESRSAIEDFQREFVLELLDEIVDWASEAEYDEIENAAGDSAVALRAAVEEVADE